MPVGEYEGVSVRPLSELDAVMITLGEPLTVNDEVTLREEDGWLEAVPVAVTVATTLYVCVRWVDRVVANVSVGVVLPVAITDLDVVVRSVAVSAAVRVCAAVAVPLLGTVLVRALVWVERRLLDVDSTGAEWDLLTVWETVSDSNIVVETIRVPVSLWVRVFLAAVRVSGSVPEAAMEESVREIGNDIVMPKDTLSEEVITRVALRSICTWGSTHGVARDLRGSRTVHRGFARTRSRTS